MGFPLVTAAYNWACRFWLGLITARTASVTTFYRWVTVSTSGLWLLFSKVVNSACSSFIKPYAVP